MGFSWVWLMGCEENERSSERAGERERVAAGWTGWRTEQSLRNKRGNCCGTIKAVYLAPGSPLCWLGRWSSGPAFPREKHLPFLGADHKKKSPTDHRNSQAHRRGRVWKPEAWPLRNCTRAGFRKVFQKSEDQRKLLAGKSQGSAFPWEGCYPGQKLLPRKSIENFTAHLMPATSRRC